MARKTGIRETNTTILLIVEGQTEQIYFSQLRAFERLLSVTIKPKLAKHSSPVHILDEAIKAKSEGVYDYIWCVFDCDVLDHPPERFMQLYTQAKNEHIRFAESFPCFEIWFLIHFVPPPSVCHSGKSRAEYGTGLLLELSIYLNGRVGKGFSESTLRNARKFYQVYAPSIQQALFAESPQNQTLTNLLDEQRKGQTILDELPKSQALINQLYPFILSGSHYLILMRIKNADERRFYKIEAKRQQWTYRQLQRQYGSRLYERLALSRDKDEVMELAEDSSYSETELEQALINNLQKFLLELGKGFCLKPVKNGSPLTKTTLWLIWFSIITRRAIGHEAEI